MLTGIGFKKRGIIVEKKTNESDASPKCSSKVHVLDSLATKRGRVAVDFVCLCFYFVYLFCFTVFRVFYVFIFPPHTHTRIYGAKYIQTNACTQTLIQMHTQTRKRTHIQRKKKYKLKTNPPLEPHI